MKRLILILCTLVILLSGCTCIVDKPFQHPETW